MDKPKPVRYTAYEGGDWLLWKDRESTHNHSSNYPLANAIEFSDGSIFDMVNGWRQQATPQLTASEVRINLQHPDAALCRALEKVELACRRTADVYSHPPLGIMLNNLANQIAKIIKDHRG